MLGTIPWPMIFWAIAALVALYFVGWKAFGPPRRARVVLVNGVTGLGAACGFNVLAGFFGGGMQINLAVLALSAALGMPGAALAGVLQWVLG
ncbi:MAG: pro-sigmaK processing inhibitor BofA family protein [Oscillospiraceae bacterium]|nr:pro-sigmaK processing inhibitor BofA family protein [Oscillospiraceae bacterium]